MCSTSSGHFSVLQAAPGSTTGSCRLSPWQQLCNHETGVKLNKCSRAFGNPKTRVFPAASTQLCCCLGSKWNREHLLKHFPA